MDTLKAVLYELLPVHPLYLLKTLKDGSTVAYKICCLFLHALLCSCKSVYRYFASLSGYGWISLLVFSLLTGIAIYLDIFSTFFIISLTVALLTNMKRREKGEMSAYSVFNAGYQQLLGTFTAEQFDNEIRHRAT
jgi:hypothetical protein